MNDYKFDSLKSSFIRDSYFPNYEKLYPDCSESFITLLKRYDGSLKEIAGEGVFKRYLKDEYLYSKVKTPNFGIIEFSVYFTGGLVLALLSRSFSESNSNVLLIVLYFVFAIFAYCLLRGIRAYFIGEKLKKRRRLKGKL
tara:strand:- start:421 stop:840 length:420 start_codon:yes stop_codon:yes gene_type:complete